MAGLLALLLLAGPTEAQKLANGLMAVLELQLRLPKGDELDRLYLSDRVRRAALRQVPGLRLMTRDNMEVIAKANGIDLASCEAECEIITGQKLGADLLVTGDLAKFGQEYKLSLRLHQVATARLLSVGQASGPTPAALDKDLDQAMAELLAPLRGVPIAQDAFAPERPYMPWGFVRDRAQVIVGYAGNRLGLGPRVGLRIFGAEVGRQPEITEDGNNRTFGGVSHPANISSKLNYVGASPLSYGTDRDGPSGWTFTYIQPFFYYAWGSAVDTATDTSGLSQSYTFSGFEFGNRFTIARRLVGSFELRAVLEAGLSAFSFENDLRDSKVNPYLGFGLSLGFGLGE